MKNMRILAVIPKVTLVSSIFILNTAMAAPFAIFSTAFGDSAPEQRPFGEIVINGDFTIIDEVSASRAPAPSNQAVGDGVDETTWVAFDFGIQGNQVPRFNPFIPLVGAELSLNITPTANFRTDGLRLGVLTPTNAFPASDPKSGLWQSVVDSWVPDIEQNVRVNLLDYYTSDEILGEYRNDRNLIPPIYENPVIALSSSFGVIPAVYGDDALISRATLKLTSVPEPSTWMLLLGALLAFFAVVYCRDRSIHRAY